MQRLLLCLAGTLALLIALVRLWPVAPQNAPLPIVIDTTAHQAIQIAEIAQTTQQAPAPPPPLPPVPVPEDEPIDLERPVLELSNLTLEMPSAPGDARAAQKGSSDQASGAPPPAVAARQISIVEPRYTEAARREGIRARVVVEVIVGRDGRVEEARIVERLLLEARNQPGRRVAELGYGLEEAALEAARRTRFLPARSGGKPIPSRKTITIHFGI